jgi:pyruvate/oxaloacetate carboxyltransferase
MILSIGEKLHGHIPFVDTTIRDGHQSLCAENMTTGMMLPIAKNLNDANQSGAEC